MFMLTRFEQLRSAFQWGKKTVEDKQGVPVIEDTESSSWASDTDIKIQKRFLLRKRKGAEKKYFIEDEGTGIDSKTNLSLFLRFMSGIMITQSLYLLLTYHSNWQSAKAAWACGIWGFIVALLMAYYKSIRAIVYLMLPSFCTGKGRAILLTYSLMMLMNGPIVNVTYNYEIMSRSLMCGDELGYNVSQGLQSIVEDAQYAVLDTMDDTVDIIIDAVDVAQDMYEKFAEKVEAMADVIKSLNDFIRNIGDICNKKLGSFLCIIPRFVAQQAKNLITDPVNRAVERIKEEISEGMMNEIDAKISSVTDALHWTQFIMGFSTIIIVVKAAMYRSRYLVKDDFDNNYITELFCHLDRKKERHGLVTILPLRPWEITKYWSPTRFNMSRQERKKFWKSLSFITFNAMYTGAIIFVDFSFWYLLRELTLTLSTYRRAKNMLENMFKGGAEKMTQVLGGGKEAKMAAALFVELQVLGDGFVPIIYRAIASSLQRLVASQGYDMSIDRCLPEPKKPDFLTYFLLISLFIALYIMCFVEGYILRTRRLIMASHYPERERTRVLYLRTKIISQRGVKTGVATFIRDTFTRVQVGEKRERLALLSNMANRKGIIGAICRKLTGKTKHKCSICYRSGSKSESSLFHKCQRPGCGLEFCISCFEDLHRICPRCMMRHSHDILRRNIKPSNSTYDKIAQDLIDSSGISDSSDSEPEEDDNENIALTLHKSHTEARSSSKPSALRKRNGHDEESSRRLLGDTSSEEEEDEF